jgi:hypothetical protein
LLCYEKLPPVEHGITRRKVSVTEQARDPIIIYGAPRSGTTYIQHMLSQHPDVFLTNESRIFLWLHQAVAVDTYEDEYVLDHREAFIQHLRETQPDVIRSFYRKLAPQARYWGDKYPLYASMKHLGALEILVSLFPGTRFIHVIRDGRDVVASLMRKTHDDGRSWASFEGAHRVWKAHLREGCGFGRAQPPNRYLEIRYEDVVQDDLRAARLMLDFLGIPVHSNVVDFCVQQREERTPLSKPTRDLNAISGRSGWEDLFSPQDRLRSLDLIGDQLVEHHYETEGSLQELRSRLQMKSGRTDAASPRDLKSTAAP